MKWAVEGLRPTQFGRHQVKGGRPGADCSRAVSQWSFVYPYPSASDLVEGNSDHGPSDQNPDHHRLCIYQGQENSDHGLSCSGGQTQTMVSVWVGCFGGRGGVDEGASHSETRGKWVFAVR